MPQDFHEHQSQPSPKPKKFLQRVTTIWDDGEVTEEFIEFVRPERGGQQKWRIESREYERRAASLGINVNAPSVTNAYDVNTVVINDHVVGQYKSNEPKPESRYDIVEMKNRGGEIHTNSNVAISDDAIVTTDKTIDCHSHDADEIAYFPSFNAEIKEI